MTKGYQLLLATLLLGSLPLIGAQAQSPSDGYRNSLEGIHGTARARAMSDAVGALGADPTAIWINPAGSVLYYQGAFSLGLDGGFGSNSVDFRNKEVAKNHTSTYGFSDFNHLAYIGSGVEFSDQPLRINWGLIYNKDYNHKRNYTLLMPLPASSITDYLTIKAMQSGQPFDRYMHTDTYDPRLQPLNQSIVLGLNAGLIEGNIAGQPKKFYRPNTWVWEKEAEQSDQIFLLPQVSQLTVKEAGGKNSLDLNLGIGYDDRYFFGATLRSTGSTYRRHSEYSEDFFFKNKHKQNRQGITYDNNLNVTGRTIGLNLGALFAIGDYGRVGISYLLPQYARYTETYSASASYYNDLLEEPKDKTFVYDTGGDFTSDYEMWLPGKLTLSGMVFLDQYGMITYDLTYRNLGSAKYMLPGENSHDALEDVTRLNNQYFGPQLRHSIALELKPLDWLTLRSGYSYTGSGIKDRAIKPGSGNTIQSEYSASGMILDYTLARNYQTASAGVGVRVGSLTVDLAYVYSIRKEGVYPYPALPDTKLPSVTGGAMREVRHSLATTVTLSF